MRATEHGLLANRSRLAQHMQAKGCFVVSFSRCIYSTAKFILCSTASYCRDQASVTSHAHSCKLITSVFQSIFASSPVQSRFCTVPVCQTLLAEVGHKQDSNYHCIPRFEHDLTTVVTVLTDAKVFCKIPKRQHCSFKFKHGLFVTCSKEEIKDWIFGHISNTVL